MRRAAQILRRERGTDEGFTLIEIIVAMFIVVTIMTAVLGVTIAALTTLAQARQRQSGAALATESIEALRALPYDTVTAGLAGGCNATLGLAATTEFVTTVGATKTFTPPASLLAISAETLVVNSQSPCARTVLQGRTTYTVRQYVTKAPSGNGFHITSVTSWTKHDGALSYSVERSTTFSPGGCLLGTLHPFSGPCQAAFTGRGSTGAINLNVTDITVPTAPVSLGSLTLPAVSSNVAVEQTVSLTSVGIGAGGLDGAGAGLSTVFAAEANSDPTSGSSDRYQPSVQTITSGNVSSGVLSIPSAVSTVEVKGRVDADTTWCKMPTAAGWQAVSTGPTAALRPCSWGTVAQPGSATATLLGSELLRATGIAGSAAGANVFQGATAGVCGATSPGCARSSASRTIPSLVFASPVGASGLFEIAALSEFALSEKGLAATTGSLARSGTLKVWDGAAYVDVPLNATTEGSWCWGASPSPCPVGPTTFPAVTVGTLTIEGALTVTKPGTTAAGPADCAESACVATRTTGSIGGSFTVTDGVSVYQVDVGVGAVAAVAGFQAAPVG